MADGGLKTLTEFVPWHSRYERAKYWVGDNGREPAEHPDHPGYRATGLEIEGADGYDDENKSFGRAKITIFFAVFPQPERGTDGQAEASQEG